MTTIAYRDGILAADRLVTWGDARYGEALKLSRSPSGHLGGAAGLMAEANAFLEWVKAGANGDPPTVKSDDVLGILVDPAGVVSFWTGSHLLAPISAPFHAIGKGADFALGAMVAGVDAVRAVEIAAQLSTATGGGIDVLRLGDPG